MYCNYNNEARSLTANLRDEKKTQLLITLLAARMFQQNREDDFSKYYEF
jgi:hypothetical protein